MFKPRTLQKLTKDHQLYTVLQDDGFFVMAHLTGYQISWLCSYGSLGDHYLSRTCTKHQDAQYQKQASRTCNQRHRKVSPGHAINNMQTSKPRKFSEDSCRYGKKTADPNKQAKKQICPFYSMAHLTFKWTLLYPISLVFHADQRGICVVFTIRSGAVNNWPWSSCFFSGGNHFTLTLFRDASKQKQRSTSDRSCFADLFAPCFIEGAEAVVVSN